jgi:putative sigma-54 modulation protein
MEFEVEIRSDEIPSEIEGYVKKKVAKLERYLKKELRCRVVLAYQKGRYLTEIILSSQNLLLQSNASAANIRLSIDQGIEKAKSQLTRYKERVSSHKKIQHLSEALAPKEEEPHIVRKKKIVLPVLSASEAIREFAAAKTPFLLFVDRDTEERCLIYSKNKDYNLLIIE